MKKALLFVCAYAGIFLLSCQDAKLDRKNPLADLEYYRNIGKRIPNETGLRWMELYNERKGTTGREMSEPDYILAGTSLESIVSSTPGFTGVAFHHGLDSDGVHHFIVIPVDESLSIWSDVDGREYYDANTSTVISKETAREWASAYERAKPEDVWFHYFGRGIFDEILNIEYFDNLQIEPAISDVDFSAQLLLIIVDGDGTLNGRTTNGVEDDDFVYDASSACPPCDVH